MSNVGGSPTTGALVTVTDTLPIDLTATAIAGPGWTCTLAPLSCTRSDLLADGGSYPITLTVNVAVNAGAALTNSATISGGGETNTANNTANDLTTVTAQLPDLTISKTHTGTFTQGQTGATYTLTVSNSGSGSTTGAPVTATDTLPAGLTATAIAGTGWTCTLVPLSCNRSDLLAAGGSYPPITLTVDVAANAALLLTNQAAVGGGGETFTANNTTSDPTTITTPPADLIVSKIHSGTFTQGQTGVTYTITASNAGAGPTTATVTVIDTLPAGLIATAMSGSGWVCSLTTCMRSDVLAAGASYPVITLTVNVAANAALLLTNQVAISGGGEINTANNSASDPTVITLPPADLTITKTHPGNFTQGQIGATYTITATNSGAGPTTGTVTVADSVPAGLTATAISGASWTCNQPAGPCSRSDVLAAGASYPIITLTVNVAANAPPSVTNSATIAGGGETNTTNNSASNPTTIIQLVPDLTITKTHLGNFSQGQTGATYTITASNSGTGPTSGLVTVTDTLPPIGLTATNIAGTGWACTQPAGPCTRSNALAAGASYPVLILTVKVAANAPSTVTNTATIAGGGDSNTTNNIATNPTTITQIASDLTITKKHWGDFKQGQEGATYTMTVTNSGSGPTSGMVTVIDTLPAGLTATAIRGTGWICALNTLTCKSSTVLAAGKSYPPITLTVKVAKNAPASVTNTATVSGGGELNTTNNTASDPTPITQVAPDLTITKKHFGDCKQGQTGVVYTMTVTNSGKVATSGTVTVTDTLPAGLTATAIKGVGWTCNLGTLTCTTGSSLMAGSTYPPITLTVNVAANAPATVTNTATVAGGGELNTTNNSASDPTNIKAPPTLGTLTPSAVTSGPTTAQSFSAVYSDANGYLDLATVYFRVNSLLSAVNGIDVIYKRSTNTLSLSTNSGTAVTSCTPGAAGILSNSQGSLNCAASSAVGLGNNLTLTLSITPTAAFISPTAKKIYMNAIDSANLTSGWIQKGTWTVTNVLPPVANYTYTPTSGVVPLLVQFDGSTSTTPIGSIVSYNWDFGDGSTDVGFSVAHYFTAVGTYPVVLTVTNSAGLTATIVKAVIVTAPQPPVAVFTFTVNSSTGALILNADGSASSSPNGAIVSYFWDWGDGSSNVASAIASHTFALPGTYSITLVITDSSGYSGSVNHAVTVP